MSKEERRNDNNRKKDENVKKQDGKTQHSKQDKK